MNYYCTLFDAFYLSRGLAMYYSLKDQTNDFHLFIFAFDELTDKILRNLNLELVTVISLNDFETQELRDVKKERTIAEYCWTSTPSAISYVMNNYDVPICTYIDADIYFYSDPAVLISEMKDSGKSVLITEHRFSVLPKLYELKRAGKFCVQFITFLKNEESLKVLEHWRKQCIEWCFSRYEDGKFGDQKYLEEWPLCYQNIHILQHHGGGIAPWNLTQYNFYRKEDCIKGKVKENGSEFDVVFFHFQYVKLMKNRSFDIGWYIVSSPIKRIFYVPYLRKIVDIEKKLGLIYEDYVSGITSFKSDNLKSAMKIVIKKVFAYNIMNINN